MDLESILETLDDMWMKTHPGWDASLSQAQTRGCKVKTPHSKPKLRI